MDLVAGNIEDGALAVRCERHALQLQSTRPAVSVSNEESPGAGAISQQLLKQTHTEAHCSRVCRLTSSTVASGTPRRRRKPKTKPGLSIWVLPTNCTKSAMIGSVL